MRFIMLQAGFSLGLKTDFNTGLYYANSKVFWCRQSKSSSHIQQLLQQLLG